MHILVVDDDIPTVEVIRTSLHWDLLGIDRVETAYDYTEAQNKICASQPDIILCDIEMPRGSGLDLLKHLRLIHQLKLIKLHRSNTSVRQRTFHR